MTEFKLGNLKLQTMKYFISNTISTFSWDQVSSIFFQRYPNPWSKHVLSDDIVSRTVEGNTLKTTRLLIKTNKVPSWVRAVCGGTSTAMVVEESTLNLDTKEIVTYSRNLTYSSVMSVIEKVNYTPSLEHTTCCEIKRQSWAESSVYGLASVAERFGHERYKKNIKKSQKGLDWVLNRYFPADFNGASGKAFALNMKTKLHVPLLLAKEMEKTCDDTVDEDEDEE